MTFRLYSAILIVFLCSVEILAKHTPSTIEKFNFLLPPNINSPYLVVEFSCGKSSTYESDLILENQSKLITREAIRSDEISASLGDKCKILFKDIDNIVIGESQGVLSRNEKNRYFIVETNI
ncbi:MAG: hypothetical protein HRU09_18025 [Oligoflexales bacterium]|nr:hypothetical protein [Oligoflexales bacterium]